MKYHIDNMVQKAKRGLTAVKVMAEIGLGQRLLVILYNQLVNAVLDYGLGLLTLSDTQCDRLERIQNGGMRTILGCASNTKIKTMRYMLGWSSIRSRNMMAQIRAYIDVIEDKSHPLHINLHTIKGTRLKRGSSWMAEMNINRVTNVRDIPTGAEWRLTNNKYNQVIITMGRNVGKGVMVVAT